MVGGYASPHRACFVNAGCAAVRPPSSFRRRRRPSTAPHRETTTTKGRPNVRTSSSSDRARARKYLRERASERAIERRDPSVARIAGDDDRARRCVFRRARTPRDASTRRARTRSALMDTSILHIHRADGRASKHPSTANREPRAHCLRTQNRRRTHAQISPSLRQNARARVRAKISARASVGPSVRRSSSPTHKTSHRRIVTRPWSPPTRAIDARAWRDRCARSMDARAHRCARSMD